MAAPATFARKAGECFVIEGQTVIWIRQISRGTVSFDIDGESFDVRKNGNLQLESCCITVCEIVASRGQLAAQLVVTAPP